MTTIDQAMPARHGPGILDRERIIAKAGFNRWLVPPAALCNMSADEVAKLQAASAAGTATAGSYGIGKGGLDLPAAIFWAIVGIPLAWGVWITLKSVSTLF